MGEPIYMRKATLDDLDAVYEIIENASFCSNMP